MALRRSCVVPFFSCSRCFRISKKFHQHFPFQEIIPYSTLTHNGMIENRKRCLIYSKPQTLSSPKILFLFKDVNVFNNKSSTFIISQRYYAAISKPQPMVSKIECADKEENDTRAKSTDVIINEVSSPETTQPKPSNVFNGSSMNDNKDAQIQIIGNASSPSKPNEQTVENKSPDCKMKEATKLDPPTSHGDTKKAAPQEINASPDLLESKLRSEELPTGLQRYFFLRYFSYLNKFQQSLENEMPDTFQMFRVFSSGLKEFIIDFRDYIGILLHLSLPGERLSKLSRRELELYYHMPWDMIRVFPVLAISSIPFGQNVAFPVAYWFPQSLLCRHFWRKEQKVEFSLIKLRKRLFNARPVFRSLQVYLDDIVDENLQNKCQDIFFKLGSGIHPTVEETIQLTPLFKNGPFQLSDIRAGHLNALLCLHGRSALPLRKSRLHDHAEYLHLLDKSILKEGIHSLTNDKLAECLVLRGFNPFGLNREKMLDILNDWMFVSKQIEKETYSLLLHLPIFLAYNHPTNLSLIS